MKDNDILLYGALAVGAYFLFIKKHATPVVAPSSTSPLLTTNQQQLLNSNQQAINPSNALTSLINTVTKAINPPTPATTISPPIQTSNAQVQANNDAIQQSVDNLFANTPSLTADQSPAASVFTSNPITLIDPNSLIQPATPPLTADISQQPVNDASYLMFENGDYPGASTMAGIDKMAARIGLY